jgi:hypothetical protein
VERDPVPVGPDGLEPSTSRGRQPDTGRLAAGDNQLDVTLLRSR